MPRAAAQQGEDELGAMPTSTTQAAGGAAAAGDTAAEIKQKLAAAAAAAKPVVKKIAETTAEGAKKGLELGKAKAEEMTSSVSTAEKRAALMVDTKVRAATLVATGQQQVVRGQALLAKTPGVGEGVIAERLGIEYESGEEGVYAFGYDAELVCILRQFDQSTAVLRSLVQMTDDTGQAFGALATSQTLIENSAVAEHTRLEAVPLDHVTRSKPSRSLRPSAEKVAAEEARYSLLVGDLGKAYGALSAATTQLVDGVAAMRERAAVIADKVVADVLLTIGAHGRWVQDHDALRTQLEALRAAGKDVTHAETRAAEVASKVAREREGVVLKVKLLEDKRREMMKRWLLDYMGMQSRFYNSGAQCFPPRPDLAQPPGTAPSHEAATAAGTASLESPDERSRLRGGYPSPDEARPQPQSQPQPKTDYSQYYSSSAADMVEQTQQTAANKGIEEPELIAPSESTGLRDFTAHQQPYSSSAADVAQQTQLAAAVVGTVEPELVTSSEPNGLAGIAANHHQQEQKEDDEADVQYNMAPAQHDRRREHEQAQNDARPSTPPRPGTSNNPGPSLEAAAPQDTASGDAVFADAEALAQRSEWDLCVHTVVRALNIGCSDMAQAHFLHGIALGETGKPVEALGALRRCLELNPDHEHVQEELQLMEEAAERLGTGETAI